MVSKKSSKLNHLLRKVECYRAGSEKMKRPLCNVYSMMSQKGFIFSEPALYGKLSSIKDVVV